MKDLSLNPSLLGTAFAARADFTTYMEPVSVGNTALPPITTDDSERRRYIIQPPESNLAAGINPAVEFTVAPVLSEFIIQFRVQRSGANVQLSTRAYVGLWNPYTSALVPEDLNIEISGLPTVSVTDTISASSVAINLQTAAPGVILSGPNILLELPWTPTPGRTDVSSWLPGRMYGWATQTGGGPPRELQFYEKTLNGIGWLYAPRALPGL